MSAESLSLVSIARLIAVCAVVIAALASFAGPASGHNGFPHAELGALDGRIHGQPDFERRNGAAIEYHPRIKAYTVRRPGEPVLFFHADSPAVGAAGAIVALPTTEVAPKCATTGNRIVVVYTHRPGQSVTTPTATLQSVVRRMNYKIGLESQRSSGNARNLAMVVDCDAAGQIEIHNVATPSNSFTSVDEAVKAALGNPTGTAAVKYLVFEVSESLYAGQGSGFFNAYQKTSSNANATQTSTAITFGGYWGTHAPVHELFHTFGAAIQVLGTTPPDPPFSTPGFHCSDGIDILCYSDGTGPGYTETRCPASQGYEQPAMVPLDCGYDTYFDAASEPNEWLDLYWNTGGSENPFLEGSEGQSVGIYRPSEGNWYLTNSLSGSPPTNYLVSGYGVSTDIPVAGDWNGDGKDSVGIYRPSEGNWYLTNSLSANPPTNYLVSGYGVSTDIPVAGDWDNDGKDSVGIYRPAQKSWYLTNSLSANPPTNYLVSGYGISTDKPVAGDWDNDGKDSVGIYRPSEGNWYLTNSLSANPPTNYLVSGYGVSTDMPVAGNWDGN